jgi:hypothetical protein
MSKRSARTPRTRSPLTIRTPENVTPGAITPTTSVPGNLGTEATAIAGTSATRKRPRDDGDAANDELDFLVSIERFMLCNLTDEIVESDDFQEIIMRLTTRERACNA